VKETRLAKGTAKGRLYCRMAIYTSASIAMVLGTVKVSTSSRMALDTTASGGAATNTDKELFGTLTERDTKVRKNVQK